MDIDDLIAYFGTQAEAARRIGVTQPSISNWRSRGRIPLLQQLRIQHLTKGKLRATPEALKVSRV